MLTALLITHPIATASALTGIGFVVMVGVIIPGMLVVFRVSTGRR